MNLHNVFAQLGELRTLAESHAPEWPAGLLHRGCTGVHVDTQDPWATLVKGAHHQVELALGGNREAALTVLQESAIAIRGMLQFEESDPNKLRLDTRDFSDPRKLVFHEAPDPHRLVYLRALAYFLDRLIAGEDPETALSLSKPHHREADPNIPIRNVLLFVQVGEQVDRLLARGQTSQDKPVEEAIKLVARTNKLTVATVRSAWSKHGSLKGWEHYKAD